MKIIKSSLCLSVIGLFIFACSGNQTVNQNSTNRAAANTNSPTNSAATTSPTAAPDELASAKKIYLDKCVRCHKEDGTGGETNIEGTKIKAPNFASDRLKKDPDSELIESIENGIKDEGMPAFKGKISDDDIKNLVKLIRREFQKQ